MALTVDNVQGFMPRSGVYSFAGIGNQAPRMSLNEALEIVEQTWEDPGWAIKALMTAYEAALRIALYRTNQEFPLQKPEVFELMARSGGVCEMSGLKFSNETVEGANRRPFIPTIDRIKPKEPYVFENCRLTCWVVNRAMNDWGDDVFWRMIKAASSKLVGPSPAILLSEIKEKLPTRAVSVDSK